MSKLNELLEQHPELFDSDLFETDEEVVTFELSEQQRYEALGDIIYFDEAAYYLNEDHWQMSRNRNLYMHHKQWFVIIFRYQKGGFGWRMTSGKAGEPEWSSKHKPYRTVKEAIAATWEICGVWEDVG